MEHDALLAVTQLLGGIFQSAGVKGLSSCTTRQIMWESALNNIHREGSNKRHIIFV